MRGIIKSAITAITAIREVINIDIKITTDTKRDFFQIKIMIAVNKPIKDPKTNPTIFSFNKTFGKLVK